MLRRFLLGIESLVRRHAFCALREHKMETVTVEFGHLVKRCLDCGYTTELGPVYRHGTNRKVKR
jgi:hypothetical protein